MSGNQAVAETEGLGNHSEGGLRKPGANRAEKGREFGKWDCGRKAETTSWGSDPRTWAPKKIAGLQSIL